MPNGKGRFDAIVVGVGGMGSATVYHLARRGKRVLGLERFDIPHEQGSSHGYTRVIRLAYLENPAYVNLVRRAYELWRDIQQSAGGPLLHINGCVDAGPAGSYLFEGAWQSCLDYDLPHEVLTSAELTRRYPAFHFSAETMALLQPDGGFLLPERCIVAYVNAALAAGAEVHGREAVRAWEPLGDGVRVVTDRRAYEAERLVFTAGAWSQGLVDCLAGLVEAERNAIAWLQPLRPELFTPDRLPVWNLLAEEGRFFGLPIHTVPGFKVGKYHHFEESGEPDQLDREPNRKDETVLRDMVARYFPDGAGPTLSLKVCLFENSPDHHFIIDSHPVYPQVLFAAGFSGHGYKFASVVGEIMADLAEGGRSRHDISFFTIKRFTANGDLEGLRVLPPVPARARDRGAGAPSSGKASEAGPGTLGPAWEEPGQ
jgi:sarcosine oxidase